MLEYYKLALVSAGENRRLFIKEMRVALRELDKTNEREELKAWFRGRLVNPT